MAELLFIAPNDAGAHVSMARIYHFACAAARRGHRATVFAPETAGNHEQLAKAGGEASLETYAGRNAIAAAFAAWRRAQARAPDAIYGLNATMRSLPPPRALCGAPVVFDFDELCSQFDGLPLWRRATYPITEGWVRRRADALIGAGIEMTKTLAAWRPDLDARARVAHLTYAYDPSDIAVDDALVADLRARLAGRPAALWFGAVTRSYQVFELLDLGAALRDRGSEMVLFVVGGGADLEALRAECAARGLADRVWIEGFRAKRSDLAAYMAASDVFVFPFAATPRNRYRCPSKLFQYLAGQKPIVTNAIYEAAWLLGDGARSVPEGDAAAMAAAVDAAVGGPPPRTDLPELQWVARGNQFVDFLERAVLR